MLNWHWMCDRDADRGWDSCWGWLVPWEDPLSIQATPRLYSRTENYCLPCCCHYSEVMVCPSPQDCCWCCGKTWQTFQPTSQRHIQQSMEYTKLLLYSHLSHSPLLSLVWIPFVSHLHGSWSFSSVSPGGLYANLLASFSLTCMGFTHCWAWVAFFSLSFLQRISTISHKQTSYWPKVSETTNPDRKV